MIGYKRQLGLQARSVFDVVVGFDICLTRYLCPFARLMKAASEAFRLRWKKAWLAWRKLLRGGVPFIQSYALEGKLQHRVADSKCVGEQVEESDQ